MGSYPAINHANPSYNQQHAQPTNYAVQGRATNLGYNKPGQMPPVGVNMASAQPATAMHQGHMSNNPPQGINMQFQAQPSAPNQGLSPPLQAAQPMSLFKGYLEYLKVCSQYLHHLFSQCLSKQYLLNPKVCSPLLHHKK